MLPVCEPGDAYSSAWLTYGFSRCFLELVGSITGAGVLYVLGVGFIVLGKSVLLTYAYHIFSMYRFSSQSSQRS